MLRVGIFGGTFDPIHHGHLALATAFAKRLQLNQLIVLPAGQPWQKMHGTLNTVSEAHHRLAMTRLGAAQLDLPETEVIVASDEIDRTSSSYTVDTLASWRTKVGAHASLAFLMGLINWYTLMLGISGHGYSITLTSVSQRVQAFHLQQPRLLLQQKLRGAQPLRTRYRPKNMA